MSLERSLELNVIREQMVRHCSFSLGETVLNETHPVYDPLVITRQRNLISEALAATISYGPMPFAGIHDGTRFLQQAKKGMTLTPVELNQELKLIRGIRGIHSYIKSLETPHPVLDDYIGSLTVHEKTERLLDSCINEYGEIKDTASSELKEIRRGIQAVDSEIQSVVSKFVSSHSSSMVDSIVTYRNGRAIVLVKAAEKNSFGGLVYGDSASGQASYIEPASFVKVNNKKMELLSQEQEEMHRILVMCSSEVGTIAEEEIANLETCGILDALFAKAQWGKEQNAVVANLTREKKILIEKARHPLIDPTKVVSNNYHLVDPQRLLLITGPNTGGKTVSMKIIGLFTLMTYCGMPIPCESAEIPFFDHVYADIGDDQSVVESLSSFSAHIQKQADIVNHASGDSLALLDEIGSGTDPKEGEALAIAILNELRQRECMCVATTHYSRLKSYGKRHKDVLLASVQFDLEALAPTYKFLEGLTGQSNALEVAERYGLSKAVIREARFLKNQSKSEEDVLIEKLEKQLNETELLKEELTKRQAEMDQKEAQLNHEKRQLESKADAIHLVAEEEANAYIEQARKEADEILKEMREKMENARYHELLAIRQNLNRKEYLEESQEPIGEDTRSFAVGDVVELRSSGQVARITEINRRGITITLNGRPIRVRETQIRHSEKVIPKKSQTTTVSFERKMVFSSMSSECNLIGMHIDEAMEAMADYMDQAKLHHLKNFRIIHGDGTGALRKAVHAKLSKDSSVDHFQLGMPQEGGTGATVVTMRD